MVKRDRVVDKLVVTADGTGQVSHAGSALLAVVADRVGRFLRLVGQMLRARC